MQADHDTPSVVHAAPAARIAWVDTARGLGILLVLIGHSQALPGLPGKWIFAFHMPLFFFLSGFTFGKHHALPFRAVLRSRARSLLVPFVFFWLASYAFWLLERRFKADEVLIDPWQPLQGLWAAAGPPLFINEALWFLSCLFVTTALYRALQPLGTRVACLAIAVLAVAGVSLIGRVAPWVPWNLDIACVVAPFFALGDFAAERRWVERGARWLPIAACAGLALTLAAVAFNERVDLHRRVVGSPLWLYAGAVGGTAFIVALSALVPPTRVLDRIGRESLTLLATHLPIYTLIAGVGVVALRLPRGFKGALPWLTLVDVGVATAIGLIAAACLRRYLPIALGARAATDTSR